MRSRPLSGIAHRGPHARGPHGSPTRIADGRRRYRRRRRDLQLASSSNVDTPAHSMPARRCDEVSSGRWRPEVLLRSAWIVRSTRIPSEKALRLLVPKNAVALEAGNFGHPQSRLGDPHVDERLDLEAVPPEHGARIGHPVESGSRSMTGRHSRRKALNP